MESLYVIRDTYESTVYGMWLASPSDIGSNYVLNLTCDGLVDYDSYTTNTIGIRPIVSLKSSVQLEKQEDGTYKII